MSSDNCSHPRNRIEKKSVPPEDAETDSEDEDELPGMNVFKDILGLPFEYPGAEYGDKEPWYFMG